MGNELRNENWKDFEMGNGRKWETIQYEKHNFPRETRKHKTQLTQYDKRSIVSNGKREKHKKYRYKKCDTIRYVEMRFGEHLSLQEKPKTMMGKRNNVAPNVTEWRFESKIRYIVPPLILGQEKNCPKGVYCKMCKSLPKRGKYL